MNYLELIAQRFQITQVIEIMRQILRIKPELWDLIGSLSFPGQGISWHAEWRMISFYDDLDKSDQSSVKSMTRIPTVLVSEYRDYAIAVEIASSRFNSFRLHFLEEPKGLCSFCADYDLKPEARVKLVSITIDGDCLNNVMNYTNLSIRNHILPQTGMWDLADNDLDLLLLQVPSTLNQFPCNTIPDLGDSSDVMEFLNDSLHWLDMEHRMNYLCQQLSSVSIGGVFWSFDEENDDIKISVSPIPIHTIRFSFPAKNEISYNLLTRSILCPTINYTLCDVVEYRDLLFNTGNISPIV